MRIRNLYVPKPLPADSQELKVSYPLYRFAILIKPHTLPSSTRRVVFALPFLSFSISLSPLPLSLNNFQEVGSKGKTYYLIN